MIGVTHPVIIERLVCLVNLSTQLFHESCLCRESSDRNNTIKEFGEAGTKEQILVTGK